MNSIHETSSYLTREEGIGEEMSLSQAKSFVARGLQIIDDRRSKFGVASVADDSVGKSCLFGTPDKDENDGSTVEEVAFLRIEALDEGLQLMMAYICLELSEYAEALLVTGELLGKDDLSYRSR